MFPRDALVSLNRHNSCGSTSNSLSRSVPFLRYIRFGIIRSSKQSTFPLRFPIDHTLVIDSQQLCITIIGGFITFWRFVSLLCIANTWTITLDMYVVSRWSNIGNDGHGFDENARIRRDGVWSECRYVI